MATEENQTFQHIIPRTTEHIVLTPLPYGTLKAWIKKNHWRVTIKKYRDLEYSPNTIIFSRYIDPNKNYKPSVYIIGPWFEHPFWPNKMVENIRQAKCQEYDIFIEEYSAKGSEDITLRQNIYDSFIVGKLMFFVDTFPEKQILIDSNLLSWKGYVSENRKENYHDCY